MKRVPMVMILVLIVSYFASGQTTASTQARVESNVVYGMHSGLALLMDVHHSEKPNGYGVLFIHGSGWHASLSYDAKQLKDAISEPEAGLFQRLVSSGYTVFASTTAPPPAFDTRRPSRMRSAPSALSGITRKDSASIKNASAASDTRRAGTWSRCWA